MYKSVSTIYLIVIALFTSCSSIKQTILLKQEQIQTSKQKFDQNELKTIKLDSTNPQMHELFDNQSENITPLRETSLSLIDTISTTCKTTETSVDDLAKQLGGIVIPNDKNLSVDDLSKFMNTIRDGWKNLRQFVINPLHSWRKKNLRQFDHVQRVFYPFGGPDATYVTQLFPHANEYILVGLEVVGSKESSESLISSNGLDFLSKNMEHFLKKGYFVTSYMTSLSAQRKGVTPLILAQLSNLGYEIISIQNGSISSEGESKDDFSGVIPFNCITFKLPNTTQEKRLVYLRCKLNDKNQEILDVLLKYVSSETFITFIKSASYILHDKVQFSLIRSYIMDESIAILQDDTGIPYNLLKDSFDIQLFGIYEKPTLAVFTAYKQPALADAYTKTQTDKLPFRFGYGSLILPSNLLLATRR
ncbi:MAG: hypothetical protein LBD36_00465 [Holosporales bacterium]|jgi:hypothetical protein|nr:hypothetical protein [Holosporales bacterium]